MIKTLFNDPDTIMTQSLNLTRGKRAQMAEDTQQKLLQSAREAFAAQGYAATSMDEFTASVGLTRGALYHHFGSKQGLFAAVVRQIDAQIDVSLLAISDAADNAWQGMHERGMAYLQMALHPDIQQILLKDAKAVLGSELKQIQMQCIDSVSQLLEQGMAQACIVPCNARALAVLINGSLTEAAFWIAHADDAISKLEDAKMAWQVLMNGLRVG